MKCSVEVHPYKIKTCKKESIKKLKDLFMDWVPPIAKTIYWYIRINTSIYLNMYYNKLELTCL